MSRVIDTIAPKLWMAVVWAIALALIFGLFLSNVFVNHAWWMIPIALAFGILLSLFVRQALALARRPR